jgi:hypothetical protein
LIDRLDLPHESRRTRGCSKVLEEIDVQFGKTDERLSGDFVEAFSQALGETGRKVEGSFVRDKAHNVLCSVNDCLAMIAFAQMRLEIALSFRVQLAIDIRREQLPNSTAANF